MHNTQKTIEILLLKVKQKTSKDIKMNKVELNKRTIDRVKDSFQ